MLAKWKMEGDGERRYGIESERRLGYERAREGKGK